MSSRLVLNPVYVTSIGLFILLTMGSFCVAAEEEAKPVEAQFSADSNRVWSAILRALQERGDPVLSTDKSSGIISTDYRFESKKIRYKFTLLITQLSGSTTKVSVQCVVESRFSFLGAKGVWDPKKSDGKREKVLIDDIQRHLQALSANPENTGTNEANAAAIQIKSGMSREEVVRLLGEPKEVIEFEQKLFLRYADITVEVREGKVIDVNLTEK